MVTELKEVLAEIEQLNSDEQKWLTYLLRQEMLWNNTFEKSQRQLSQLGDEAVTEFKNDKNISN